MMTPEEKAERQARRAGNEARRTDLQTMQGYNKLVGDILKAEGVDHRDYVGQGRDLIREYRQSTKGLGAEYDPRDTPYLDYDFLPDDVRSKVLGGLGQTADTFQDYNLRRALTTDLGSGASMTHGFNPRAVGTHVLGLNENKFQRVGNMLDLAKDYWGKPITEEQLADFGELKQRKKMGDGIYQVKIGNNAFRDFEPGTEQVPQMDSEGNPVLDETGNPVMITQDKVNPGSVGDSNNYVKAFVQRGADGSYKILPKEAEPFRKYYFKEPDKNEGFLGGLGPIASIAAAIPGPWQPFAAALSAANAADQGNWGQAILAASGIQELGGFSNPLYNLNPINNLGPAISKAGDLNWTRIAADAAARGGAAAIDGRDVLSSAASALAPVTGLPGPLGGMAIQYGLNALRGQPNSPRRAIQNTAPTAQEQTSNVLPWQLSQYGGSGSPAAPRAPMYK